MSATKEVVAKRRLDDAVLSPQRSVDIMRVYGVPKVPGRLEHLQALAKRSPRANRAFLVHAPAGVSIPPPPPPADDSKQPDGTGISHDIGSMWASAMAAQCMHIAVPALFRTSSARAFRWCVAYA